MSINNYPPVGLFKRPTLHVKKSSKSSLLEASFMHLCLLPDFTFPDYSQIKTNLTWEGKRLGLKKYRPILNGLFTMRYASDHFLEIFLHVL